MKFHCMASSWNSIKLRRLAGTELLAKTVAFIVYDSPH